MEKKVIVYMPRSQHGLAKVRNGHLYTWGRGFAGASDANFPQLSPSSMGCTKAALGWNHCLLLSGDEKKYLCLVAITMGRVLCDLKTQMSAVKHLSGSAFIRPALALLYMNTNICDK
ncbi:hypothetical protein Peur_043379 [Populus x canadensis]